jgi:GntR family transcriptional regulator
VDSAEEALRHWLSPGRHRVGDRLPPEHDLASMLRVSRGTLRAALQRLEDSGEIVRRQGSGTFVGRVRQPTALREGLERLESYASLARNRGVKLGVRDLRISSVALDPDLAEVLEVPAGTKTTSISRVLTADGEPAGTMVDTIHPETPLPPEKRLLRALERGDMVLDVLTGQGLPISFATTRIVPRLVTARERCGKALGIRRATAILELEETYYVATGEVVYHSRDTFAPGGLDLHVIRWLGAERPPQVGDADDGSSERGRRGGRERRASRPDS